MVNCWSIITFTLTGSVNGVSRTCDGVIVHCGGAVAVMSSSIPAGLEWAIVVELRSNCDGLIRYDADLLADDCHADLLDVCDSERRDVDILLVHVVERVVLGDWEYGHDSGFETNGIIVERFGAHETV